MERATRLIVLTSTLAAGVAYGWFVGLTHPAMSWAAAAAFVASFGLTRVSVGLAVSPVLLTAYLSPALLFVAFGVADYHHVLVWLAALTGVVAAAGDRSRWHVPGPLRLPLIAWAVVVAATWPVIVGREIDFSLTAAQTLDTPNGLQAGSPADTAAWIASVALGHLAGLLWLDLLWQRFGVQHLRQAERMVFVPLTISAVAGSLAGVYQQYVDPEWLSPPIWSHMDRSAGLMLDANSFGTTAAIWAPLALTLAWQLRAPTWSGGLVALLLAAGMWSSGSRTAFVVALAGAIGLSIAFSRRARAWPARRATLAVVGALLVVVATAGALSGNRMNPVSRLLETLPRAEPGAVARFVNDLWVRDGYGTAANLAMAEHPWTGIGIGAFNPLATDYYFLAARGILPPDNAQNWWRQQLVELGVVGAVPSLLFSAAVLLLLWQRVAVAGAETATVLRAVLIGVGLASLVGVATQHPAIFLTFVTLLYWLGALIEGPAPPRLPGRADRLGWLVVPGVAAAVVLGQLSSARGDLRVPVRAARAGFTYAYGFSQPEAGPEGRDVRWSARRAVGVIRAEYRFLRLTMWTPHADATDPVGLRVWRNGELVIDLASRTSESITRILHASAGDFVMLELEASREIDPGRALKVAAEWLPQLPDGVPPESVIP